MHAKDWAGCCDELVEILLAPGGVIGVRQDGVWTGRTALWGWKGDRWKRDDKGFPLHTWIKCADGTIIDPTRWVFEGVLPYVYKGSNDHYKAAR